MSKLRHLLQQGGTWSAREVDELLEGLREELAGSAPAAPERSPLEAVEQLRADLGEQLAALVKRLDALEAKQAAVPTIRAAAPAARVKPAA